MSYLETSDGTTLFYNDWGAGRPIVLIHGWPLDADMWEYQARTLAEQGFRVVTYDRRGFGRSSQPWTGYDYDTLSADLAAVIDKLDLRDVTLVGFSMGGGEVARYLAKYGSMRIARAVLVSAVTPYLLRSDDNPEGAPEAMFDEMAEKMKADRPAFLADFGKKFYGVSLVKHPVSAEFLEWTLNLAMLASPRATLACMRAWSTTDFRTDMKAFTMPTLIVHGTGDTTVPPAISAEKVKALVPHAELKLYEGAPHGLQATNPDELCRDLAAFAGG